MEFPGLVYGMSTKADGSMGAFSSPRRTAEEEERRRAFFGKEDIVLLRTVSARLEHGNTVTVVDDRHAGTFVPATDALVTQTPNLALCITVADCLPVYLYDPRAQIVGIAHAGWRGAVALVALRTFGIMRKLGALPETTHVRNGPGIHACHFEIQNNVRPNFDPWREAVKERDGRLFADLPRIVQLQLRDGGIPDVHIETDPACTFCDADHFFSYRRDKPVQLETMVAFIGLRS